MFVEIVCLIEGLNISRFVFVLIVIVFFFGYSLNSLVIFVDVIFINWLILICFFIIFFENKIFMWFLIIGFLFGIFVKFFFFRFFWLLKLNEYWFDLIVCKLLLCRVFYKIFWFYFLCKGGDYMYFVFLKFGFFK